MNSISDDPNSCFPVNISQKLFDDLDVSFLGTMAKEDLLKKYLTCDPELITERHSIFKTIINIPEFGDFIGEAVSKIDDLISLKRNNKKYTLRENSNNEKAFSEFRELLFFTECIDTIADGAITFKSKISSELFQDLFEHSQEISESLWYKNAKLYINKITNELKSLKSVTLGVNLNTQLGVKEFGIISLNDSYYTTNSLFDKMFSKKIANKEYICIAPVSGQTGNFSGYSLDIFNNGLYNSISSIVGGSVKRIKGQLYNLMCDNTSFIISYYNDLKFIYLSYKYIISMQACGLSVCFPEISNEYFIHDLYNPNFAGNIPCHNIIKNDITFDRNGQIYLLTGANSGGKTAFLRSVGISQVLFQLGLPIPAKSAKMKIFKNIFSHFASKVKDETGGRFENECRSILNFYNNISEDTLLLLDEMFSTTSSFEGTIIAEHVLKKLAICGCRCIYTTHLHDLPYKISEINSADNIKGYVDNLSAQVIDGICTYKILRQRDSYGSLAETICKKYGFIT